MRGHRRAVTDHDQLAPCAGQRHIHAAGICQKAHLALTVRADERNDHHIFFASLKTIHAVDLQLKRLQLLAQGLHLCRVGRNDRDLFRLHAAIHQLVNFLHHQVCLLRVEFALAFGFLLFIVTGSRRIYEMHGALCQRGACHSGQISQQGRADRLVRPQAALVKHIRRKAHDIRVHAVLHIQPARDLHLGRLQQPFHQADVEPAAHSLRRDHGRRQLEMIACQYQPVRILDRDPCRRLHALTGFIHHAPLKSSSTEALCIQPGGSGADHPCIAQDALHHRILDLARLVL